jgi:hypothetical protein
MYENGDVYDDLADKIIGWMDPKNHPADALGEVAYEYWRVAKLLKQKLPPTHERQVTLRKLLESFIWATRCRPGAGESGFSHAQDFEAIDFWLRLSSKEGIGESRNLAYQFWVIHESIMLRLGQTITFERVQAARLLLESRDAALRALLESLAEQQKQELRVVSQS